MNETRITVARGDGIGPEILDATLEVLHAAQAGLEYDFIEVGEQLYRAGHTSGIAPESWAAIRSNTEWNSPSDSFMMLSLVMQVTLRRP